METHDVRREKPDRVVVQHPEAPDEEVLQPTGGHTTLRASTSRAARTRSSRAITSDYSEDP